MQSSTVPFKHISLSGNADVLRKVLTDVRHKNQQIGLANIERQQELKYALVQEKRV